MIDSIALDPQSSRRGTLLEFAVEENQSEFVKLLLENNADPDVFTPSKGYRPIHEAAEKGHVECLRLLLSARADVNARSSANGRTALHELLSGWEDTSSYKSAFKELVNHPKIDINIEDDDESTPLEIAACKKLELQVNQLIALGAVITENVREALQDYRPDLLRPDLGFQHFNNNTHVTETELRSELFKAIRNNNPEQCEAILNQASSINITIDLNKTDTDGPTYLQFACEAGFSNVVEFLLNHGARPDVTSITKDKKPIFLACIAGNNKIIQLLLENRASTTDRCPDTEQTVLHEITQRLSRDPNKYFACLQMILAYQNDDFNINAQDHTGNTALNFAVMSGCQEAVLLLLRHGADISIVNVAGVSPLRRIHPKILKAYLDECITSNRKSPTASDFVLSFDYSFLSAPLHSNTYETEAEFEAVVFPEVPKLSRRSEIEILREIASSKRLQPLLRHPIIRSFVSYKWHKISWAFWLNCVLFLIMIVMLTSYVVLLKDVDGKNKNMTSIATDDNKPEMNIYLRVLLNSSIAIFAIGLFCRELFQMSIDFERYLHSFENYVEILLIVSTMMMLATREDIHVAVNFAAIAIILAWLELLLLVGRYPELSTYIAAFVTVSKTFLIMLFGYSLLIVGFALSFYVLNVFDDENDEELTATQGITRSIMKCYVMMTGELDYGDLNFEEKPFVSKGVFLFFVFLVTIILLNLLNALAVSDTQIIKNK
ncbi:hypothetical protein QYM36_010225, partial [Artemia franciscana]